MGWIPFFICMFALGLAQGISYHLLIHRLFCHHRSKWIEAGQPLGGFDMSIWSEAPWLKGSIAGHRYFWTLLISTPGWVNNDEKAQRYLIVFRIGFFGFLAGIVGFFIIALLIS